MANLPKIVRQRLQSKPGAVHPDADLLTAFAERTLGERERAQVLEHLSACAACREVVSLALPEKEEAEAAAAPQSAPWWGLRWQTVAAMATVAVAAIALLTIPNSFFRARSPMQVAQAPAEKTAVTREGRAAASPAPEAETSRKQAEAQNAAAAPGKKQAATYGAGTGGGAASVLADAERERRDESPSKLGKGLPTPPAKADQVSTFTATMKSPAAPPPTQTYDFKVDQTKAGGAAPVTTGEGAPAAPTYRPKSAVAGGEQKAVSGGLVTAQKQEADKDKAAAAPAPAAADQAQATGQVHRVPAANETVEVSAAAVEIETALRWRTSSAGKLEHSRDAGKNWRTVNVASGLVLNAVSAVGEHVWAGGHRQRLAVLYHSGDGGAHWTRLDFTGPAGAQPADVVALNFTDFQHGVMTVVAADDPRLRQIWTTADGGRTWTAPPAH